MKIISKIVICVLLAIYIALSGFTGVQAQHSVVDHKVYMNPVIGLPAPVADPFVMKWNGEYYLYSTGNPIMAFHSKDLVTWEEIGPVLYSSDDGDSWNQTDVWAPEVVYRNGKFYMNYTATKASADWRIEEMARRIGVAVSDTPEGPFVDIGHPVTPGWGIDSHVFLDPDHGKEYLFYSYFYEPRHPGAGLVADKMKSYTEVAGKPTHITRGTEPWEDKKGNPKNGSLRYTNEAPTVLKRNGLYYMMYSGGSWDLPTYSLAYAVSDNIIQGGLDGPGWKKVIPPILQSTDLVQAPGHNSVTKAPNNVDDITAYHARVVPFRRPGDRETFIDRVYWVHDRLHMNEPRLGALSAPDFPIFRDNFDRANGSISSRWEIQSGNWRVVDEHIRGSGLVLPNSDAYKHYVFEANIRFENGATEPAGVVAYYKDSDNRFDVWLDPDQRVLRTSGRFQGEPVNEVISELNSEFKFNVYHQLLVTKNADKIRITLDGVHLQYHRYAFGEGRTGLITGAENVDYDGIALTPHYLDHFNEPEHSWETFGGGWFVDEGALHQVAGGEETYYALKGNSAENYEFIANVKTRDKDTIRSTTGIVAADDGNGRQVIAGYDHHIWPYAAFWVRLIEDEEIKQELNVGTARGFMLNEYHSIRVVKQGDNFTFFLDEAKMAAVRFSIGEARPGIYTQGVRAAFDDVAMKHTVIPYNLVLNGNFLAKSWRENGSAPENPWQLSGSAEYNMCCGHSGNQRLQILSADGKAEQRIENLEPGHYVLYAWISTINAAGKVTVELGDGSSVQASTSAERWKMITLEFDVTNSGQSVKITANGNFYAEGEEGLVAMDDFFLVRQE